VTGHDCHPSCNAPPDLQPQGFRVRAAYPHEAEGLYVHLGDLIEYLADCLPDKAANVVTSYLVDLGAKLESDT
jgi:hypothetical protein